MIDRELRQEISNVIMSLKEISSDLKKDSGTALRAGGKVILGAIQSRAPIGKKVHKRYSTAKLNRRMRAPKGSGKVIAAYYPGNLRGSFGIMRFRRSNAVFVGPRVTKGRFMGAAGAYTPIYGRGAYDGYYAHMVEHGTRNSSGKKFVLPAVSAAQKNAVDTVKKKVMQQLKKYAKAKGR